MASGKRGENLAPPNPDQPKWIRAGHRGPSVRTTAATLLVLGAALVPLVLFLTPPPGIRIDGQSDDWLRLGVPFYREAAEAPNPDVSLSGYAALLRGARLYLAAEVSGTLFGDTAGYDGVYFFLDADGDPSTGYAVEDLGAEGMVRVVGGARTIADARFLGWRGDDPLDYGSWEPKGAVPAASSNRFVEVSLISNESPITTASVVRVVVTDFQGNLSSSTLKFGGRSGALRIEQHPLTTIIANATTELLQVTVRAFGSPVEVRRIDFLSSPVHVMEPPLDRPVVIEPDRLLVLTGTVDGSRLSPGTFVTLGIDRVDADSPFTIVGTEARAYVAVRPLGKVIDGIFEDWSSAEFREDAVGETRSRSTDLASWGAESADETFLFYLRFRGPALFGTPVPEILIEGKHSQERPTSRFVSRPRISGEDFLRVWIDRDPGAVTGEEVEGIYADVFLNVAAIYGRITAARVHQWSGTWQEAGDVTIFLDRNEAEGGFALAIPLNASVIVEATSWDSLRDVLFDRLAGETRGEVTATPSARFPPFWPSWLSRGLVDPDDPIVDSGLDLLALETYNVPGDSLALKAGYIFVRFVVEESNPVLTENTWWLYLDSGLPDTIPDDNNDWLVAERATELCSYRWDDLDSDWGISPTGCDLSDSPSDTDNGSAVRVVPDCYPSQGCIDFALEKSDYPGLGERPRVSLASNGTEDRDLNGDPNRNPLNAIPTCMVTDFDDCTSRVEVHEAVFPIPIPPSAREIYPVVEVPPTWPPGFLIRIWDPDDPIADSTLDILEGRGHNFWPGRYIYIRIVVQGANPVLTDNTWWLYLDNGYPNTTADSNNDWLVAERADELCSYRWDDVNGDWGLSGTSECDVSDTLSDTDTGSAVRVVPDCYSSLGCIDFALEKSDYPGLGQRPWFSLAANETENLSLRGDPNRNPTDAPGGCSVSSFQDCTYRVELPEFPTIAVAVVVVGSFVLALRRRRRKSGG